MYVRQLLLLLVSVFVFSTLQAQDIHFSQFNMSPMTLNPSNIGAFEGTVRIGGIFRGQFSSVIGSSSRQFTTPSVYVDAPIIRGFRKKDWVGVGLMFFSDKVGFGKLMHSGAKLGASYHFALNKKATTYVTLGAQYGKMSRKLNAEKLEFEEGWVNQINNVYNQPLDIDFANLQNAKADWTDIDGGITLRSKLNPRMDFSVGYAMYHIAQGKYGLLGGSGGGGTNPAPASNVEIGRRSVATGQFNIKLNDKFTVSPTFVYQTMAGAHDEIIIQGLGAYLFNPEKEVTLLFGAGYRLRDAIHPIVGAQIKTLRIGIAYDVNVSDLTAASNYRGGFEIAANYIIKIYKPAVIKTRVLCPRY